jgi:polygalacturonase
MQFDIEKFGAVSDGKTLNTLAVQKAIDACHKAGGGRVFCGPGAFLTGSLQLKGGVELHLAQGCRLLGSTNLADYADFETPGFHGELTPENSTKSLIRAYAADDIAITGAGEINAQGLSFFNTSEFQWEIYFKKPLTERPRLFMAFNCRRLRIEGVSLIDSPCWTVWLMKCEDVRVHRITISADQRMINNDGIDFDACRNVIVSDSRFKTSDDCLVLRSIQQVFDEPAVCENITVTNCVLDSWCQGVRIGCPSDYAIRNATFSNLVITSRNNGIISQHPARYLTGGNTGSMDIRNISFDNVLIECQRSPILINVESNVSNVHIEGLRFSNFRIKSGGPCLISGDPKSVIRDISFNHMDIETTGPDALLCRQCDQVRLNDVTLSNKV